MSNISKATSMQPIFSLMSVFRQSKQDLEKLNQFADYLRNHRSEISKYEGVCIDMRNLFVKFDFSKPYQFNSVISALELLSVLSKRLDSMRTLLSECKSLPDRHNKADVMKYCVDLEEVCLKKMPVNEIERACEEVDVAIQKINNLKNLFNQDDLDRQKALCLSLADFRKTMESRRESMWKDDYVRLEKEISSIEENSTLSDSLIGSLRDKMSSAISSRRDHISSMELQYKQLTSNRHISNDYQLLLSRVLTKSEYDYCVNELIEKLKKKRKETFIKVLKIIGKILAVIGTILGAIFVFIGDLIFGGKKKD